VPSNLGTTLAISAWLSRNICCAAAADEAEPLGQKLEAQYSEDAEQSGSRQALLSTAQGSERVADQDGTRLRMEEQPWKGIDIAAGEWRARCTPYPQIVPSLDTSEHSRRSPGTMTRARSSLRRPCQKSLSMANLASASA